MIYLIACEENKTCKIGFSNSPEKRLSQLQTGNPNHLILVAVTDGDIKDEKILHEKFKKFKINREWFSYSKEIREYFGVEKFYFMYSFKTKVFTSIFKRYSNGAEFSMNKTLKEVIAKESGCSQRSLDNSFSALIKDGVIVEVGKRLYRINPMYVFKGSESSRKDCLKAILTIKYDESLKLKSN